MEVSPACNFTEKVFNTVAEGWLRAPVHPAVITSAAAGIKKALVNTDINRMMLVMIIRVWLCFQIWL